MIFSAAVDRSSLARSFDICVIGAGPAGIVLAQRVARAGAEVALMEAGGAEFTAESQGFYRGTNVGLDYFPLDTARIRFLGGSSNHWEGMCRELDPIDFQPHIHHPLSGWPISKPDLDPYASESEEILDLSPPVWRFDRGPDASEGAEPVRDAFAGGDFERIAFRFSPPVRFGEKYRDELAASDRIHLFLNANLVDLRLTDDLSGVESARFRSYDPADEGFLVRARYYCVCAGGIENARILLNARSQIPEGIGNRNDLVGRFFCEHPTFTVAEVLFETASSPGTEFFAPRPRLIAEERILNAGLRLHYESPQPLSWSKELVRGVSCATGFSEVLAERVLGREMRCVPGGLGAIWDRRSAGQIQTGELDIASEQALNPDSRVMLGDELDAFGLNRPVLDWRLTELDFDTIRKSVLALGMGLAEQGIARIRVRDWLLADVPELPGTAEDEVGGWHHMCTTRMSDDPRHGVVDHHCRVHGISNLFVGGSSSFATAGHANPTYTIVQLALRLGDHLTERLKA